jgi:hypothetical protein
MPFQTQPSIATLILGGAKTILGSKPKAKSGTLMKHRPLLPTDICDEEQKWAISAAFAYSDMLNHIIKGMGGACETLADKMLHLGINDLMIACDFCRGGQESSSDAVGGQITMRICSFPQLGDLTRIVMREQVRLAGGMPVDVWAVDSWVWFRGAGGDFSALDPRAKPAMCAGATTYHDSFGNATTGHQGTYVIWWPVDGSLWTRDKPGTHNTGTILINGNGYWKSACM